MSVVSGCFVKKCWKVFPEQNPSKDEIVFLALCFNLAVQDDRTGLSSDSDHPVKRLASARWSSQWESLSNTLDAKHHVCSFSLINLSLWLCISCVCVCVSAYILFSFPNRRSCSESCLQRSLRSHDHPWNANNLFPQIAQSSCSASSASSHRTSSFAWVLLRSLRFWQASKHATSTGTMGRASSFWRVQERYSKCLRPHNKGFRVQPRLVHPQIVSSDVLIHRCFARTFSTHLSGLPAFLDSLRRRLASFLPTPDLELQKEHLNEIQIKMFNCSFHSQSRLDDIHNTRSSRKTLHIQS